MDKSSSNGSPGTEATSTEAETSKENGNGIAARLKRTTSAASAFLRSNKKDKPEKLEIEEKEQKPELEFKKILPEDLQKPKNSSGLLTAFIRPRSLTQSFRMPKPQIPQYEDKDEEEALTPMVRGRSSTWVGYVPIPKKAEDKKDQKSQKDPKKTSREFSFFGRTKSKKSRKYRPRLPSLPNLPEDKKEDQKEDANDNTAPPRLVEG
ncbi:hypothetical protein L596_016721 [Steinernema carpocapsae]|uniref:Uncharacterized protein n=1 Tax=Steinernema carpocapsae TaxID=34508 RepID=A0A4U5NIV8_STECR|nr:hypothetical protein L596_016721 [Steinernema carpocapsae]